MRHNVSQKDIANTRVIVSTAITRLTKVTGTNCRINIKIVRDSRWIKTSLARNDEVVYYYIIHRRSLRAREGEREGKGGSRAILL